MGFKVGVLDADIYDHRCQSCLMLKTKTNSVTVDGKSKMKPVESYDIKCFLSDFHSPSQAVIWRGPMASKALNQMILMLIGRTRLYVNRLTTRNWRYSSFFDHAIVAILELL
jgi:Mrp family chromosome partitioning ATPase